MYVYCGYPAMSNKYNLVKKNFNIRHKTRKMSNSAPFQHSLTRTLKRTPFKLVLVF